MSGLEGKVAFITGAARGQGRSHAVRLASDGADIVAVDICHDIDIMNYPNAAPEDLEETARLVKDLGRRILPLQVDVRDPAAVSSAVETAWEEFGRLDIVLAQAGIVSYPQGPNGPDPHLIWQDTLATNLSGAWYAASAAIPKIIEGGRGGVILFTGSTSAVRPPPGIAAGGVAYTASKGALVAVGKMLAAGLATHSIRVNVIHPTGVVSGMTMNDALTELMKQAAGGGSNMISTMQNAMPVEMLQPEDISDTVAFLVSDRAKWITGVSLPIDAGYSVL